ncbi:MAG: GNAT family protein [Myxococcota bacterium]
MQEAIESLLPSRGKRVVLRAWQLSDVPTLRHWNLPGHHWHAFNGPYFEDPTVEEADALAERVRNHIQAGRTTAKGRYLPLADASDDSLLGTVSCYELDETGWTAAGITMYDDRKWGQGLGTEGLGLYVDFLFRLRPDLHRLDLRTWSGNHGMLKVAERLGFTLEARFREARVVEGVRYDGIGYGLLRTEWAAR